MVALYSPGTQDFSISLLCYSYAILPSRSPHCPRIFNVTPAIRAHIRQEEGRREMGKREPFPAKSFPRSPQHYFLYLIGCFYQQNRLGNVALQSRYVATPIIVGVLFIRMTERNMTQKSLPQQTSSRLSGSSYSSRES